MKASDYRKQVEQDLSRREEGMAPPQGEAAPDLEELVKSLADSGEDPEAREKALKMLRAASFLGARFNEVRPAFVEALRAVAVGDDDKLRHSALDVLSNLKDEFAQEKLQAGLLGQIKPLVPTAVALGMLARDDHASLSNLAKDVLESGADKFAKAQAARILGSDPSAQALLEKILGDKSEFREVRRASAAALNSLDPEAFVREGRKILEDDSDFKDIQTTVRGALQRAGKPVPAIGNAAVRGGAGGLLGRLFRLIGSRGRTG